MLSTFKREIRKDYSMDLSIAKSIKEITTAVQNIFLPVKLIVSDQIAKKV